MYRLSHTDVIKYRSTVCTLISMARLVLGLGIGVVMVTVFLVSKLVSAHFYHFSDDFIQDVTKVPDQQIVIYKRSIKCSGITRVILGGSTLGK